MPLTTTAPGDMTLSMAAAHAETDRTGTLPLFDLAGARLADMVYTTVAHLGNAGCVVHDILTVPASRASVTITYDLPTIGTARITLTDVTG